MTTVLSVQDALAACRKANAQLALAKKGPMVHSFGEYAPTGDAFHDDRMTEAMLRADLHWEVVQVFYFPATPKRLGFRITKKADDGRRFVLSSDLGWRECKDYYTDGELFCLTVDDAHKMATAILSWIQKETPDAPTS